LIGARQLPVLLTTALPTTGKPAVHPGRDAGSAVQRSVVRPPTNKTAAPPPAEQQVPAVHRAAPQTAPTPDKPGGQDLDDLARRLLEPVGRLLRAELRHGRERAGRLHDRRR
jgi:hypothetical protein